MNTTTLDVMADSGPLANVCARDDDGSIGERGWHISYYCEGEWKVATKLPFATKRDCELAVSELRKAGILTAQEAYKAGRNRMNEIMYSNLPW